MVLENVCEGGLHFPWCICQILHTVLLLADTYGALHKCISSEEQVFSGGLTCVLGLYAAYEESLV